MLRFLRFFYVVAALGCLGIGAAQAQAYQPGLLVLANGDTLRGEVENGFWQEPPRFVHFRRGPGSPSASYLPRQLRAVSFSGGRLLRYEALPLDHAATTRYDELPLYGFSKVQVDTVLADVLVDGPASLRRVVGPRVTHYLVGRPGQPLLELSERHYLRPIGGDRRVVDGNNYRGQLGQYFQDCPAAFSAAQAAAFTPAGLGAVVQAFNAACGPARQPARSYLALARPRRPSVLQGGVLLGVRYHRLESPAYELAGRLTDGGFHPFGGLYAELLQPGRTASFYGELSLTDFRNQGVQRYDFVGVTTYTVFDYHALLGTARIGVRYFLPLAHDQQLLLGFGFEYNQAFGITFSSVNGGAPSPASADEAYVSPVLFPNLSVGWRQQRISVVLDGQFYRSRISSDLGGTFFGSNVVARLALGYRLGRNPDSQQAAK